MSQAVAQHDAGEIRNRAFRGAKILAIRTAFSQLLRIGASIVVARSVAPEDFGIFAIVAYISGLGVYVQSLGLGSALTQRQSAPDEIDWRTAYFAQLLGAIGFLTVVILLGGRMLEIFDADPAYLPVLIIASCQPILSAFNFVPQNRLYRELEFTKIATASFISDVFSVGLSCILAVSGFGIWTLVIPPIVAITVNAVILNYFAPFSLLGSISLSRLRPLLKVGIPIQVSAATPALLNGWIPYFAGRLLGAASLGSVNLSQRLAAIPVTYLQILNQVAFPAFSRLQSDREQLVSFMAEAVYRLSVVGCGGYLLLAPWLPEFVTFVYGSQWQDVGKLLQFLGMSTLLGSLVNILGPSLNATGHSWLRVTSVTISCGIPWMLAPWLIPAIDLDGVGTVIVISACIDLSLMVAFVSSKIGSSRRLLRNVFLVVGFFVVLAIALSVIENPSALIRTLSSFVGAGFLAGLGWYELQCGSEPTPLWFFRRLKPQRTPLPR